MEEGSLKIQTKNTAMMLPSLQEQQKKSVLSTNAGDRIVPKKVKELSSLQHRRRREIGGRA